MKTTNFILSLLCLFISTICIAQKTITANRIAEKIKINGELDELSWKSQKDVASNFTAIEPTPNGTPAYKSEVKVIYDDVAIYISAYLEDASRDSIMTELMQRDQIGNTDFFGVIIDTYGNGNSAFEFIISSTGVQFDAKLSPSNEDSSWDAVWNGATTLSENGWYLEMMIPYSAIRFSNSEIQDWNINFFRRRTISGEKYSWINIDYEQDNPWLTQIGKLEGVSNIKPPVRLSITPYASVYGIQSHDSSRDPVNTTGTSYNLGMDIKYGINDAYTLDMTLIPDFGQVQSDAQILNLSPFEIRFNENRAFFTEGLEMFDKSGIFYSRRIGQDQQLYNATKISGRNEKGFGVGFFNAVAGEKSIDIVDEETNDTEKEVLLPLTNFNVIVLDKDLKNNSSVSLTNSNVSRRGTAFNNANVTAGTFNLKNKKQSFGTNGRVAVSQIILKEDKNNIGHDLGISLDKLSGAFRFGGGFQETSKNYNHNDLGYFRFGNYRQYYIYSQYRDFDGFGIFNNMNFWANTRYNQHYETNMFMNTGINFGFWGQTKSFLNFDFWSNFNSKENDFNEPRVDGRYFVKPEKLAMGYWFGTDNRKPVRFSSYANINNTYDTQDWFSYGVGNAIRYRVSDKLNFTLDVFFHKSKYEKGFANITEDDEIIFGQRNIQTVSNVFSLNYTLNNKMGFDLLARHYWSKVVYNEFYHLESNGQLSKSEYDNFHDLSFNAFTIDATYRWIFAPGSELTIVWKNNISGVLNNADINYNSLGYKKGVQDLSSFPQTNSLSVRFSYFLDYTTNIKKLVSKN